MIDEGFVTYARRVREQSYRLGVASIEDEEAVQLYGIVFTYAASVASDVTFVELGAGLGYASLWAAKALDDACTARCRLIVVEGSRRYAEKASTMLHSYPFRRVSIRVVHGDPIRVLERLDDYSVDIAVLGRRGVNPAAALKLLERRMVVGGIALVPGAYSPGLNLEEVLQSLDPGWKITILPVGRGLMVLVRVKAAGEGEEATK